MSTFHTITNQVKQSCQRNVEAITDLIQANARRGASHFLVSRNAVIQQGSSIRLLTLCSTNALYRYSFVWRKPIHICEPLKAGNRRTEILHVRSPAGRATATSETMRKRNTGDKCNSTNNIPSEKWKRHGFSKPMLFKKYRPESSASAATRDYKSTNEDKLDGSSRRLHQSNALSTKNQ